VPMKQAEHPFHFYARQSIQESTGWRAVTLPQFLKYLRIVPGSVIYHHTHHYLQQHQFLSPEPPNDFSYWAFQSLGARRLGERLASISTIEFDTIRSLREEIVRVVEEHLRAHPLVRLRIVPVEEAFYFVKAVTVVFPTPYTARSLKEFSERLESVTIDSLYFHIFEARLRLERGENDFSRWFETGLGEPELARAVRALDPYTHTMEELRGTILRLVRRRLEGGGDA